jgi:acetate kinase
MILAINGGSSSIKFALFKTGNSLKQLFNGAIENIGTQKATLNFSNTIDQQKNIIDIEAADHDQAANHLIDWLEKQEHFDSIKAIGHRIVHGMDHTEPELVTDDLLNELKKISAFDPEHLPEEIKLIETFSKRYPALKQVACFDTSFHTSMPPVAKLLSIPRRYYKMGIQRYGFHGLSYAYLMQELERIAGNKSAKRKIILAHLGNGASVAAVKDGKSIDTSMGFTPTSGLPMGTRTGDLDPGVAWYLMQYERLDPKEFNHLINHESGLLGISETSADMRELMKIEDRDERAAEAIELFCYQTKKWIGSFAAVLGGLDVLVFSGGIGENSPDVRSRIGSNLEFPGIELDKIKNINNQTIISADTSKVNVYVIKTNEELMIATLVGWLLNYSDKNE